MLAMRYWVYQNSRILGPYDPASMSGLTGLNTETLVCAEDVLGRRDTDWRRAADVPELADLSLTNASVVSVIDDPLPGSAYDYMDRIQLETSGAVADGDNIGQWLEGFLKDVRAPSRSTDTKPKDGPPAWENTAADTTAAHKINELSAELRHFQQRVKELETQQDEMLRQLTVRPIPRPQASAPTSPPVISDMPQNEPAIDLPIAPLPPSASLLPPQPPALEMIAPILLPPQPPSFEMIAPVLLSPQPQAIETAVVAPPERPAAKKGIVFTMGVLKSAKSVGEFKVVKKAGEKAVEPAPAAALIAPLPEPEFLSAPISISQQPLEQEPAPFLAAKTAIIEPELLTAVSAAPPQPAAQPAVDGSSKQTAAGSPSATASDVMARLARPAPSVGAEQPKPQPKNNRNRIFIAASAGLVVVSAILFMLFFRSKKDVSQMVAMDAERAPIGAEPVEEPAPRVARVPQPAAPVPQAPPAPAAPDPAALAMALVKGYPLDGNRGSVAQWLQYSFAANPGDGHKEDWTAGGIADSTYLVEYKVTFPTGGHEPISYLFEADTVRKTLLGRNPAAKQLLAGLPPTQTGVPAAKTGKRAPLKRTSKPKRRPKAKAARTVVHSAPPPTDLLPLPSDDELHPSVKDDAGAAPDASSLSL